MDSLWMIPHVVNVYYGRVYFVNPETDLLKAWVAFFFCIKVRVPLNNLLTPPNNPVYQHINNQLTPCIAFLPRQGRAALGPRVLVPLRSTAGAAAIQQRPGQREKRRQVGGV